MTPEQEKALFEVHGKVHELHVLATSLDDRVSGVEKRAGRLEVWRWLVVGAWGALIAAWQMLKERP